MGVVKKKTGDVQQNNPTAAACTVLPQKLYFTRPYMKMRSKKKSFITVISQWTIFSDGEKG